MSLGKSIIRKMLARSLEQRAEREQKGLYTIEAAEGPLKAKVEMEDADRLGCLALSVEIRRTDKPEKTAVPSSSLRVKAEQVTKRLGYLLENLEIVEIDCREGVCQIRSLPAEIGDFYYEIILKAGGRASLARYEKFTGKGDRIAVSMNFSLEILQRLVDDLAAAV